MPNNFLGRVVVTGPAADVNRFVADMQAVIPRPCFCLLAIPAPNVFLTPSVPPPASESEDAPWSAQLTPEEELQLIECGGSFESLTEGAHWGCRGGCYDMRIQNANGRAQFKFWTPLSPMSRLVGVRLKQKYPKLAFAYSGHDEFDPQEKPIWSWAARQVATDDDALEAILTCKMVDSSMFLVFGGMDAFQRKMRAKAVELTKGDIKKANKICKGAFGHLATYMALLPS
jgi:hypothetical protein